MKMSAVKVIVTILRNASLNMDTVMSMMTDP